MFEELDNNSRKALLAKKMSLRDESPEEHFGISDVWSAIGFTDKTCGDKPLVDSYRSTDEFNTELAKYNECKATAQAEGQANTEDAVDTGKSTFDFVKNLWGGGTSSDSVSVDGYEIAFVDEDEEALKAKRLKNNIIISVSVVVVLVLGFVLYRKYKK